MNINGAQVHLVINHAPVIGFPLVLLTYLWGSIRKELPVQIYALYLNVVIWLSTALSYFSGDFAEDKLRTLPDFNKILIHAHEDTAEVAFVIASLSALFAILLMPNVQQRLKVLSDPKIRKHIRLLFLLSVAGLCLLLAVVAHEGGLIRHVEIR